jgi:hypothetical protein
VPGSQYLVQVSRAGDHVVKHGIPTYHGPHEDRAVCAVLMLRHQAAATRLRLAALQRNDKRHTALDELLQPLENLISKTPPADRDAILAYVHRRLSRAW